MMDEMQMGEDEVAEIKEAFGMFDINGDGTIQLKELKQVMIRLGQDPSDEDLREMMKIVDVNGDNEVDFNEFLVLMKLRSEERDTDGELMEAFRLFDTDGSGNISRTELHNLMKNLGQELTDDEIDMMIDEVDTDLDGEISFEEFKALMVRDISSCADSDVIGK